VKALASEADSPPEVVTWTPTLPAACGGTCAFNCEELITVIFVAGVPPKLTEGAAAWVSDVKFDPLMVTTVPPSSGPELGTTDVMAGVELF
jgi:hypothetical protein